MKIQHLRDVSYTLGSDWLTAFSFFIGESPAVWRGITGSVLDPNTQHLVTLPVLTITRSRFPRRTCATSH